MSSGSKARPVRARSELAIALTAAGTFVVYANQSLFSGTACRWIDSTMPFERHLVRIAEHEIADRGIADALRVLGVVQEVEQRTEARLDGSETCGDG